MSAKRLSGTLAAPAIAKRSEERSYAFRSGWLMSVVKIVGAPGRTVIRSSWISCSACVGS